jgi:hypothetical protein
MSTYGFMPYNPASLKNLEIARQRKTTKQRHAYTIEAQHHEWLAQYGNASKRLDELLERVLSGDLVSLERCKRLEDKNKLLREKIKELSAK